MNQYSLGKMRVGDKITVKPLFPIAYEFKDINFDNETFEVMWIHVLRPLRHSAYKLSPSRRFMLSYVRAWRASDGKVYQFRFHEITSIERG